MAGQKNPLRTEKDSGSTMGAWYSPQFIYCPEELGGLSSKRFAEAVRAEIPGFNCWEGGNFPLHTHPFFKDFDFYHAGKPSRILFADRDVRELDEGTKPSERIFCVSMPAFKKFMPEYIDKYVEAFRTIVENHEQLLDDDYVQDDGGRWYGASNAEFSKKKKG